MNNRLQLDWTLEFNDERNKFVHDYLQSITFTPTSAELDTISKYILWGKDRKTGLNGRQEGLELETSAKTWDEKRVQSLDSLLEAPNFNEASLLASGAPALKTVREVFSRSTARKLASPALLENLEALWRLIDETELLLNFYDIAHGKRSTPPRDTLKNRFTEIEYNEIAHKAATLTPLLYLKKKRDLVELRRQQYMFKDVYAPTVLAQSKPHFEPNSPPVFDEEIWVLPVGVRYDTRLDDIIWNKERFPCPSDFTNEDLLALSKRLWRLRQGTLEFDFRKTDHLYALFSIWNEMETAAENLGTSISENSLVREFMRAASTYRSLAHFDEMHEEIFNLKLRKVSNQDIAAYINAKYSKSYKVNYISTLYCKKCLEDIAQAAIDHREVLENMFYPENFKECKDCGRVLLLGEKNFVKRHRSNDGYSPRCKRCEKLLREKHKEKK